MQRSRRMSPGNRARRIVRRSHQAGNLVSKLCCLVYAHCVPVTTLRHVGIRAPPACISFEHLMSIDLKYSGRVTFEPSHVVGDTMMTVLTVRYNRVPLVLCHLGNAEAAVTSLLRCLGCPVGFRVAGNALLVKGSLLWSGAGRSRTLCISVDILLLLAPRHQSTGASGSDQADWLTFILYSTDARQGGRWYQVSVVMLYVYVVCSQVRCSDNPSSISPGS